MNPPPEKTSLWRECALALVALLLIGGAVGLTFAHVLQSGPEDISGRYDIYRYYAPITFFLDYCLEQGELPLWNPLVYCGLPNAANPQAFVFYPLNLIRGLLLPDISPQTTNESLVAFAGLHLLLLGFFSYLLARAHRLSFPAALVVALAWVCSALIVRRACEYHFLYTLAWLPLILLLVKSAIDAPAARKRLAFSLLAGLVLGIATLGGFLQIVGYLCVCVGVYALFYRILRPHDEHATDRPGGVRGLSNEFASFALIFVLGGLVALALLLPVAELAGFSARQKGMPVPMYSDMMAWDVTRLYQSLVVFPGMRYEAETLRGPGIIVLLLALAGCFHPNRRLAFLGGILTYAMVDCGFGPPFPIASLVELLTPFSQSAYSRGFDLALLPLGLLAGLGVDALWRPRRAGAVRVVMAVLLVYGAAATLIPLAYWANPHPFLQVGQEIFLVPIAAVLACLVCIALPQRWRKAGTLIALLMPALVFAETWSWNRHYVPWMIKRQIRDHTPVRQSGHHFPETNNRTTDPIANRALYSLTPVMNGVDPLHFAAVRDLLSGTPRDKRSHRLVTEWEPTAENHRGNLLLKRFFWLSRYAREGALPGKQELFPVTTTTYLPDGAAIDMPAPPSKDTPYESVSDKAVRVEIPGAAAALSRQRAANGRMVGFDLAIPAERGAAKAGSAGTLHSTLMLRHTSTVAAQIDTRFVEPGTNRRLWGKRHRVRAARDQLLEVPLPDLPETRVEITIKPERNGRVALEEAFLMVDTADEDRLIEILDFSANQATLRVGPLPGPRILTFLDAWYPGWHAYVDGEEIFVLEAADVFKAIPLSKGTHEVQFVFRPRSVYIGVAVSITAFLGGLIAALWLLWRGQDKATPAKPTANDTAQDW